MATTANDNLLEQTTFTNISNATGIYNNLVGNASFESNTIADILKKRVISNGSDHIFNNNISSANNGFNTVLTFVSVELVRAAIEQTTFQLDGSTDTTISKLTPNFGATTVTSLTDGTATLSSGNITGAADITATGTVQGGTITDGTISLTSGNITGAVSITTTGNVSIGGNLTVSGTTTTVNTETIELADNKILLNSNATGPANEDAGIEIERGDDDNKTLLWDETNDKWTVGNETFVAGTFEGNLTGNVTGSVTGSVSFSAINRSDVTQSEDDPDNVLDALKDIYAKIREINTFLVAMTSDNIDFTTDLVQLNGF